MAYFKYLTTRGFNIANHQGLGTGPLLYYDIPHEDAPSAWILNAGTTAAWTDVSFKNYVPNKVKALDLNYCLIFTGNGSYDYCIAYLRKNGSSSTSFNTYVLYVAHPNCPTGTDAYEYQHIPAMPCDDYGVIEYYAYGASGARGAATLYLNIRGYWILAEDV